MYIYNTFTIFTYIRCSLFNYRWKSGGHAKKQRQFDAYNNNNKNKLGSAAAVAFTSSNNNNNNRNTNDKGECNNANNKSNNGNNINNNNNNVADNLLNWSLYAAATTTVHEAGNAEIKLATPTIAKPATTATKAIAIVLAAVAAGIAIPATNTLQILWVSFLMSWAVPVCDSCYCCWFCFCCSTFVCFGV